MVKPATVAEEALELAQWHDIPGYVGRYQINQLGEVRGLFSGHGKEPGTVIRHQRNPKGYAQVGLHAADGSRKTHRIHRLVAVVFMGQPPDGLQINHKDGNKMNPSLGNLEYVTASANQRHAVENGLLLPQLGESHGQAKLTDGMVRFIRTSSESSYVLGRRLGVSSSTIRRVRCGESWGHVSIESAPFQTWLGTGQALLARLQELYEKEPTSNQFLVGRLIRKSVEHFGRMP